MKCLVNGEDVTSDCLVKPDTRLEGSGVDLYLKEHSTIFLVRGSNEKIN